MQLIPAMDATMSAPEHLAPLISPMQDILDGKLRDGRFACTMPVRHGKTTAAQYFCAALMARLPKTEIMYIAYGTQYAQRNSRIIRSIYQQMGGQIQEDHNTIGEWRTSAGGQLLATGIDGGITGRGCSVLVVDDPIKSREDALSSLMRDKAYDTIAEIHGRLSPGGSVFIIASRFHSDDPTGRFLAKGFTHIHMPAIIDEGLPTERPLWEQRPLDYLRQRRREVGEYLWLANFMGQPPEMAGGLFRTIPPRYETEQDGLRVVIGIDLAYSDKKAADHSAIVALGEKAGLYYVLHVDRFRSRIDEARHRIRFFLNRFPGAEMYSYVSGAEKGPIHLLIEDGITIQPIPARYNKSVRAQRCAEEWSQGRIHVPHDALWLSEFMDEVRSFTGEDGGMDDQVDAMVSAFDVLHGSRVTMAPSWHGKRRL